MYYHRIGVSPGKAQEERIERNRSDIRPHVFSGRNRSVPIYHVGIELLLHNMVSVKGIPVPETEGTTGPQISRRQTKGSGESLASLWTNSIGERVFPTSSWMKY